MPRNISEWAQRALLVLALLVVVAVLAITLPTLAATTEPATPPAATGGESQTQPIVPTTTPAPAVTTRSAPAEPPTAPTASAATSTATPSASTSTSSSASEPLPVGQTGPWHLVFHDDFNGNALDQSKWSTCYPWADPAAGCTNAGDNEIQWYASQGVTVKDGVLTLSTQPGQYKGSDGKTYPYSSGMLDSALGQGRGPGFSFQYGYVEARLKIPAGRGLGPAFWLASADGSWPPEVDIVERVGGANPHNVELIVHYPVPPIGIASDSSHFSGPDFASEWHVFGLAWTPTSLTWYIDGVAQKTFPQTAHVPQKPMNIVLTLAVRDTPAPPDQSVKFPATLSVDYVRVWQR